MLRPRLLNRLCDCVTDQLYNLDVGVVGEEANFRRMIRSYPTFACFAVESSAAATELKVATGQTIRPCWSL